MDEIYDVTIIGGGPGGYNCAIRCGQLGLKTLVVEKRQSQKLGGTCLNVGCIPSKALLHASELYENAKKDFSSFGIKTERLSLCLDEMMKKKDEAVEGLTKGQEFLFRKNGVQWRFGTGRIAGEGRIAIATENGDETLRTRNIVIATGSEATPLNGVPFDGTRIISSEEAIALDRLPKTMAVVGAGVIGLELGSVWRRLGAEVTIVEYSDRILPNADAEISKAALRIFEKQGLAFRMSTKVVGVENGESTRVVTEDLTGRGSNSAIHCDCVLVAIGRRPISTGIGLKAFGVECTENGFIKNFGLRTTVPNVWAIGDCTTGEMLAHKAEDEGIAVAEMIAGVRTTFDGGSIPNVVYTSPELAWVGRSEEQLKADGVDFKKGSFPLMANSRARTNFMTDGFVKILAACDTDQILGVHIIGPHAGEHIAEATLAMSAELLSEDIARTPHAHPTLSEALRQAAMGVGGWTMQA